MTSESRRKIYPLAVSLARYTTIFAIAGVVAAATANSATLYWDGADATAAGNNVSDQFGLGGAGSWDVTTPNWWDPATTDIAWSNLAFNVANFGGAQSTGNFTVAISAPVVASGLVFTRSGYTLTGTTTNSLTLDVATVGDPAPLIVGYVNATIGAAGQDAVKGTNGLTKTGAGTLILFGATGQLSGPVTLSGGGLSLAGTVTATGTTITLNTGTLSLLNNGSASNVVAPITTGNNVVVNGNATITVNNVSANNNNAISINNLTVGGAQLTVTNANNYGFVVAGTTTLTGPLSSLSTSMTPFTGAQADPNVGLFVLQGLVTGAGPLNKVGTGTVVLQWSGNDYTGGTNILAGSVLLNTATAKLGSGNVIVNPGAALDITRASHVTLGVGQTLAFSSSAASLSILRVSAVQDVVTGSSLGSAYVSPYGASFQFNTGGVTYGPTGAILVGAAYNLNIDLSAIGSAAAGNGKIYLGGSSFGNIANSGISFTGLLASASDNVFRLGAGGNATSSALTIATANALNDTRAAGATVTIGHPIANVQTITNGTGTVIIGANQNYSGATTINKGSTLTLGAVNGVTTPFGTAPVVNNLGGTLNLNGNSTAKTSGTFNIFQGGTMNVDVSALSPAITNTDVHLDASSIVNLYSGTFTFTGVATAAITSNQTLASLSFSGGSLLNNLQGQPSPATSIANLTLGTLTRNGSGTLVMSRSAGSAFGTNSVIKVTTGAPTPTNGMVGAYYTMIDATAGASFANYTTNGFVPAAFTLTTFTGANATSIVDIGTSVAAPTASVYALRIGTGAAGSATALTGTNTVTIVGTAGDGAGLILNSATAAQNQTPNFLFGNTGDREALIYVTGQTNTLSGSIGATGLTKFGPNQLTLTGVNTGLAGTVTLNQGILNALAPSLNYRPVVLNAGTLQINTAASLYLNDVTVNGDATLDFGTNLQQRLQSLTVSARTGSTDPVTLSLIAGAGVFNGTMTLNGSVNLLATGAGNQNIFGNFGLGTAALAGTGELRKFGAGQVVLATSSSGYSGAVTVYGNGTNNINNMLRSQAGADTDRPFGTGSITVLPGGAISLANPLNISGNTVILTSDLAGLATIALNYNGSAALPTVTTFNNGNVGGPFSSVLAIDAVGFSTAINLNTFGGGTAFLGTGNGGSTGNYTGILTPSTVGLTNSIPSTLAGAPAVSSSATGVYRIGAGGGITQFFGANGQFAAGNDIQVGAISNVHQYTSVSLANGNGSAAIYNVNAGFNGNVVLNGSTNTLGQGNLIVGQNNALGSGTIIFNGGGIQADANTGLPFNNAIRTISNSLKFAGDVLFNGVTDLRLISNVGLADGQTGVTRVISVANTTGLTIFAGNISDGAGVTVSGTFGGNSITKIGAGPLVFTGTNTYSGFTNINAGTIVVASDTDISPNSQITLGGGALGVWNSSFTTNRDYIITGATQSAFDIGAAQTLAQSATSTISGTNYIQKLGQGTMVLNGINTNANSTASWSILNGILAVSSNVNLGDPLGNSTVYVQGGTLRILSSFATARGFNTNNTGSGSIDVVSGATLTMNGVLTSTGAFTPIKTGLGTVISTAANTNVTFGVNNGTWQTGNSQPFATTASVSLNGGTLLLTNLTANQAVTTSGTVTFGGGGHLNLQSATGFSSQFTPANLNRSVVGTLIIDPGTSTLGVAGNANNVRINPSAQINGVAVTSANVNGILPASMVIQTGGLGSFATYDGATTGIKAFTGLTPIAAGTLPATTNTTIADVTGAITAFTTPTQSLYGLRTNSDIAGGTLAISSLSSTNQGGVLINATVNIGANLLFDPTAATGGSATSGEGLFYVAPGAVATLSGSVFANSFTKFGTGGVTFAGTNAILGTLSIQEGTMRIQPGATFTKLQTDLVLNGTGTFDLNGGSFRFNSLSNSTTAVGGLLGGIITNTGAAPATFAIFSTSTTTPAFSGIIQDGTGTVTLVKNGTGTLTLGGYSALNPDASNNSYTGGTILNQGTLIVQNPLALGGANGTTPGAISLFGGTLNLQSNGGGINGTIILGNQSGLGATVNVLGPTTINVDRVSANTGNSWQIGTLNMAENNLTVTGANSYHLRVNGQTNLLGGYASFTTGSTSSGGTTELLGKVTGSAALNKFGNDVSRMLILDNSTNDYSGGTNIVSGRLIVNATSGTPLGSGRINVFPGGMLSLTGVSGSWAAGTIGGAPVRVLGSFSSMGLIGLDNDDFDPTQVLTATSFSNAFGNVAVAITRPFYSRALDQSALGDGRSFLTGGLFAEVDYVAATLAPGLGDGIANRVYRLGGSAGSTGLGIVGADNVLSDSSAAGTFLQAGARLSIAANAAIAGTGNIIYLRNSNSYTGGTQIGKGTTIQLEAGGSPSGSTPLGSFTGFLTGGQTNVEVYGTLQTSGQMGSFFNAATGHNANSYTLRPGGAIIINDVAGTVAGSQGRWEDTQGINLNGGTFQFNGANGYGSWEKIGTVRVDKGGRITVSRAANAGTATLVVNDLVRQIVATNVSTGSRDGNGTLIITTQAAGTLGIPASATISNPEGVAYDRVVVSNTGSAATVLGGLTSIGTGVKAGIATAGVAPAWIFNATDSTFVTYSPTTSGGNTGYQGLVSVGSAGASAVAANGTFTPGANQVGYSKVITTGLAGGANPISLVAGDTVDITTVAFTLASNPTIYALRTNQNIISSGANNTLTITGDETTAGLISLANLAIGAAPTNATANLTLNFGTSGAAEGIIFQGNNVTTTINAQIGAAGLTFLSPRGANDSAVVLTAVNSNLTGPLTINSGRVNFNNTLGNAGVLNNQDVIIGGYGLSYAAGGGIRVILTGNVGSATTSILPSTVATSTQFGTGTWYINGDAQIDNNNSGFLQRITNLTIADLGTRSPIHLALQGVAVTGTTTLGAHDNYIDAFFSNPRTVFLGPVVGGTLTKFGNGDLLMANPNNSYAGSVVNPAGANTASSVLASISRTGTPFGTGSILVNPGAGLRVVDPGNISSNSVSLKSDGFGLASIGIASNITPAALATLVSNVHMTSTGDYGGVVALDANSWNSALSMAALEAASGTGKPLWLGSSINPSQVYFNSSFVNYLGATLTAGMGNTYRIGGGGNQGNLALGVGQFENVLSGDATLQIGATTAGLNPNGPSYINGNFGILELNTRNTTYTGDIYLNLGGQLIVGNGNALSSAGTILANGGGISIRNAQFVSNPISFIGDTLLIGQNTGLDGGTFTGNVYLAPNGVGGNRIFSAASNANAFEGIISDAGTGTGASNIVRTSSQANNNLGSLVFRGLNTYHGTTQINNGFLFAGTDVAPNVAGAFGISDTPIIFGAPTAGNAAAQLGIAGQFTFGRGLIVTAAATGNAINTLRSQAITNAVFTGGIAINTGSLAIDATSTANSVSGVFDIQGSISGVGALQIGGVGQGIVRLSNNVNGLGTNTYSGGTVVYIGRLQIASDTYYTGPANNPIVISGPLGTGTVSLGSGGTTTAGVGNQSPGETLEAYGADRTIVNALNPLNFAGNTNITFGGEYKLTFTRDLNLNSDATLRNRAFIVTNTQAPAVFSGNFSQTGAGGTNFLKQGNGVLILSGTNTQANINNTDASYGTGVFIDAGTLSVNSDAALGSTTVLAAAQSHLAGAADVRLRGGVLQTTASFASTRQFILTAASTIDVVGSANTLNLTKQNAGAFALTKVGTGTLELFNNANVNTGLNIGGVYQGGGVVSTNQATGTPFGAAASTIVIGSGTLALSNPSNTTSPSISTTSLEVRGGAYLKLTKGTTQGSVLTATSATLGLTRGTVAPQGTLTILPSALSNLGVNAANSENFTAANFSAASSNTNGMLTVPFVQTRLSGVGQDASFVQYGSNGFTLSSTTTVGTLGGGLSGDSTKLADLPTGTNTVAAGDNQVYAVRTSGDIVGTDLTSRLGIGNGGLIINGATAPTISSQLVFGTIAAGNVITPLEGIVYVREGQTGGVQSTFSTLSGGFTATNFTKAGPGNLLIGGVNVMAPLATGVGLRVLQINEGTLRFTAQSALPSGGLIFINPMDTGTLDLNGVSLNFAGLGVGTAVAGVGTGQITSAPAATLTLSGNNLTTQFNGLIGGNLAVVKTGTGTQIIGSNTPTSLGGNTYTGGTTIGTGYITSGSGVFASLGNLQVAGVNGLGSGPVTLAGGTLTFVNAIAASEVVANFQVVTQGPGAGYNLTIAATNSFGSTNTTSILQTGSSAASLPTGVYTAINNLTVNAPVLSVQQGQNQQNITNGILVGGTTTLAGDTVFNINSNGNTVENFILAGQLNAGSFAITKIGSGNLTLTNNGNGVIGGPANSAGSWTVLAGVLEARVSDGGSNPLVNNTTVTLNGGQLNLKPDGDNLSDAQNLSVFSTNTLVVGSLAPVSSANYISSVTSTLNLGTVNAASNKTVQFKQLQFGGPLGTAFLNNSLATAGFPVEFLNGLTMVKDAYLGNQNPITIDTMLSGNGTLYKQGANSVNGELDINTVATNTGGTVIGGGIVNFASYRGNTRTLNMTAKLGPGNITVNPGGLIRFNGTGNVNGRQLVDVRSNLANLGVIGIGDNSPVSDYHLRSPQAYGAFNSSAVTALNSGSGVLAINSVYSQAIDLSSFGDGTWFIGSNNNGAGVDNTTSVNGTLTGTITASKVGYNFGVANVNNGNAVYRLGAAGAILNVGTIGGSTALADLDAATKSSIVIGAPLTNSSNTAGGATVGNGSGTVFFNTAQTYTGNTLVNRNSTLEVRSTMATSGYEVFGTLAASGNGGTFVGTPVVLRTGAILRLDNSLDLLPVASTQGRYGDSTAVNLDSGTFAVNGNAAMDLVEKVGTINVAGGSTITPRSMLAGRVMEINAASIVRSINNNGVTGNNGQLSIQPVNAAQLGTNERVTATTIANYAGAQVSALLAVQNGMVAPWMYNGLDNQFLTYSDFGFVNAGFNLVSVGGTLAASLGTGSERLLLNTAAGVVPTGGSINVWALRPDTSITLATANDAVATVTIGSGGIIATTNLAVSVTPKIVFGSLTTPTDAFLFVASGTTLTIGDLANRTTSGQIVATNIAKTGPGTLSIDAIQPGFTGNIAINGGAVSLRDNQTVVGSTSQVAGGGAIGAQNIIFSGYATTLNLRSDVNGIVNFNQNLVLTAGNANATINVDRITTGSPIYTFLGGLTFGGSPGDQGQTLSIANGNSATLVINGTTDLGPAGYAYFNLTNAASNNVNTTLAGTVTGSATLVREGASTGSLWLGAAGVTPTASNTFTGGIIMNGNLAATAVAPANGNVTINRLGDNNTITLISGTFAPRVDQSNNSVAEVAIFNTNTLNVVGNVILNLDRLTANGGTNKVVAFKQLNIGGQSLSITQTNSFKAGFNAVNLTGFANISVASAADSYLQNVSDNGAGLGIIKNGGGYLYFNGTNNNFSGGVYANQGAAIRFGTVLAASSTAKAGTGTIQINPGGVIILEAAGNLNAGQKIDVKGIANSVTLVQMQNVFDPTALITATSSGGFLAIPTAYTVALNLASIGDGTFQLATSGNNTYIAATLGVGAGNVYRLAGNTFQLNFNTAANVLTGTARVQVGALVSGGTLNTNQANNWSGGTTVVRGSTLQWNPAATTTSSIGTGQVDVFGQTIAYGNGGNYKLNTFVLHPGAQLRIDNNGGSGAPIFDRYGDTTDLPLNGANLSYQSQNAAGANTETFGKITFENGTRVALGSLSTASITLTQGVGTLDRVGHGTLVFTNGAAGRLGNALGNNAERLIVTAGGPTLAAGMAPAYFIAGTDNTFVTYDNTNGFGRAAFTNTVNASFTTGLTNGLAIVDVGTAAATLLDNPIIYALRTNQAINNAPGQINTITLNGTGTSATGGLLFSGSAIISPNVSFNGAEALIYAASGATGQFSGDILNAATITKFGTGVVQINKDQSDLARGTGNGLSGGWNINEGQVTANVFGALGNAVSTNIVSLNGSQSGAAILRLQANQGNASLAYYSMSTLAVLDNGSISYDPLADDRTQALGAAGNLSDIKITSTGGALLDAQLLFATNRSRSTLVAGNLQIIGTAAGAILNIGQSATNNNLTSGVSSGLSVNSLIGNADQRVTKWGNATLYVRSSSPSYSGAVNIEQGPLQISSPTGLGDGSATNKITVKRYGTLDLNTTGFSRTDVVFQAGSILRLTADAAIASSSFDLGAGTLQVANDQTTTTTQFTMAGGGAIEGFLRVDDVLPTSQALYRTLGSGVTFNLTGNTAVGQSITEGANGLDSGRQPTVYSPLGNAASGVILEIKGAIEGVGSLTKQGYDVVTLSGANTYSGGTVIKQGMLRFGAADRLPSTGSVSTTGEGVMDLNGFNQTIGRLSSPSAVSGGSNGYITNTATVLNTLKVGNGNTGDAVYGGVIQYNVAVEKVGTNVQTLTNTNTYVGPTTVTAGVLEISGSLSGTTKVDINNGGTLTGNESVPGLTAYSAGRVNVNSGGTFSPGAAGATAGVNAVGTFNAGGGLSFAGGGTLSIDLSTPYQNSGSPGVNDRANVTGTVSLTGTNSIVLSLGTYVPNYGEKFFIVLNDGADAVNGLPSNFGTTLVNLYGDDYDVFNSGAQMFAVSFTADQATGAFSGAGNDIAIMVVPEPNALAMLAGGLALAVGLRRFRRGAATI